MNLIPIDCYCQSANCSESFECIICKKFHHSKCYAISVTEILPKNMKCIDCRLKQYEPFLSIKGNLFTPKKYFILNVNESYNKRELKADFRSLWSDFVHNPHYEVVIVCSKLKPSAKKAVYENDRLIEKKHQIIPQYEWPSENIFLEWNSRHIKYSKYSFAFVPRDQVKQVNYLSFTTDDLKYSSFITVLFVSRKGSNEVIERVLEHQKTEESSILQILKEQYKNQIEKTIQYGMEDEQVRLESPYLSLPLIDPLTFEQLEIPIRGRNCQHIESYDLGKFIDNNKDPKENRWKCPRCLITIDIDNIMVDFIQAKILNDINLIQPSLKHTIQKVFIIDNDLNYVFDHQLKGTNNLVLEKFQQNQQFLLQLNMMKENVKIFFIYYQFPPMIDLFDEIFDKNLNEFELDKEGTTIVFDILELSTDSIKLIQQEEQTVAFFSTLFDCQKSIKIYLTPDQDYSKLYSLVFYCEQFYKCTFQGVFADYCCRIQGQIKNMINHILAFANFYPRENHFQAILEISLALSYAIKKNKNFEKYKQKSYGYIVGYLLNLYYEKCEFNELGKKIQNLKYIHSILSELLLPSAESVESIFNTAEFLLKYFNVKNKEGILSILDSFYLNEGNKLKSNDQLTLAILVYFFLVQIKKEKNKNQKNDKSSYYIPASTMNNIKQIFEEILEYMTQKGMDIKSILEKNHLKFKDFRYAYTVLEYSNYNQSSQQAVI